MNDVLDAIKEFAKYSGKTFNQIYGKYRYQHTNCKHDELNGITLLLVEDVSYAKIDGKTKTIDGIVDTGTSLQGNYGSTWPYNRNYICSYKNFYLIEDEYSPSRVVNLEKTCERVVKDEMFYWAARILPDKRHDRPENHSSWNRVPGEYEDPSQLDDFHIFCEKCAISKVVYPPKKSDKYPSKWTAHMT